LVTFFSIIAIGFFLGMRHAMDPDHVIAVTTIVSGQKNIMRAALIGIVWGIGHTLTIFVVGSVVILFNVVIPARIGLSMELTVGFMLVVLDLMNVVSFFRFVPAISNDEKNAATVIHSQPHSHGEYVHSHAHVHLPEVPPHDLYETPLGILDRSFGPTNMYRYIRPLVVGIVHGQAGSAAVALLVLGTIRDPHWAVAYLLVFGGGTVAGMLLITISIASAFRFLGNGREKFSHRLGLASGLVSLVFGIVIAYQTCFASGIFAEQPHWVPR
jgi:ABC-type nickel/cobalt efflux system permease component RcnA